MSDPATFYSQPFLSYGPFLESIVLFLGKINTQKEENFEQFVSQDKGFQHPKNENKNTVSSTMATIYIYQKLK